MIGWREDKTSDYRLGSTWTCVYSIIKVLFSLNVIRISIFKEIHRSYSEIGEAWFIILVLFKAS